MGDALDPNANRGTVVTDEKPAIDAAALQSALDAKLKEMGYDEHAKDAISKRNAEAKSHRERAEAAEKKLQEREAADAERTKQEQTKAEAEAAKKKAEDDAKKSDKERLESLERTFAQELAKRDDMTKKQQAEYDAKLKARDRVLIKEAVRVAAIEKGVIDKSVIDFFDLDVLESEDGGVDKDAIAAFLEVMAEEKPFLFKKNDEESPGREDAGRFSPAKDKKEAKTSVDWSKADKTAFAAQLEKLRNQR